MPTETVAATDLKQLAEDVLARALKAGATDAEAVVIHYLSPQATSQEIVDEPVAVAAVEGEPAPEA